jgi:hypothetical protein
MTEELSAGDILGTGLAVGFGLWSLKILSGIGKKHGSRDDISYILTMSQPAFSGSEERRLLVRKQNLNKARRILERYGYKINNATEVERGIILLIFEYR